MITKKEKALLDHLYKAGEEIADFMKKNGYSKEDFDMVSVSVGIDRDADGIKYDYITSTFSSYYRKGQPRRIVSETSNHITKKAEYREHCCEEGK